MRESCGRRKGEGEGKRKGGVGMERVRKGGREVRLVGGMGTCINGKGMRIDIELLSAGQLVV